MGRVVLEEEPGTWCCCEIVNSTLQTREEVSGYSQLCIFLDRLEIKLAFIHLLQGYHCVFPPIFSIYLYRSQHLLCVGGVLSLRHCRQVGQLAVC